MKKLTDEQADKLKDEITRALVSASFIDCRIALQIVEGTINSMVEYEDVCPECGGYGCDWKPCKKDPDVQHIEKCPNCNGTGKADKPQNQS